MCQKMLWVVFVLKKEMLVFLSIINVNFQFQKETSSDRKKVKIKISNTHDVFFKYTCRYQEIKKQGHGSFQLL